MPLLKSSLSLSSKYIFSPLLLDKGVIGTSLSCNEFSNLNKVEKGQNILENGLITYKNSN